MPTVSKWHALTTHPQPPEMHGCGQHTRSLTTSILSDTNHNTDKQGTKWESTGSRLLPLHHPPHHCCHFIRQAQARSSFCLTTLQRRDRRAMPTRKSSTTRKTTGPTWRRYVRWIAGRVTDVWTHTCNSLTGAQYWLVPRLCPRGLCACFHQYAPFRLPGPPTERTPRHSEPNKYLHVSPLGLQDHVRLYIGRAPLVR